MSQSLSWEADGLRLCGSRILITVLTDPFTNLFWASEAT